jgi:hypothetical protein
MPRKHMRGVELHSFLTMTLYGNGGQIHVLAALPRGRTPFPLTMRLVGPCRQYGHSGVEKNCIFRAGIRTPDSQVRSLVTTPTAVSRLLNFHYPHLYFYCSYFSCGLLSSMVQGPSSGLSSFVFEFSRSDSVRHTHHTRKDSSGGGIAPL